MILRFAAASALLALTACAASPGAEPAQRPSEAASPAGPPTVDGVFTFYGCEGEGGCLFDHWRAVEPTPMLAAQSPTAEATATLRPDEWIQVDRVETRLAPRRGTIVADAPGFRAGDVVYSLWYEGEGYSMIWREGAEVSVSYDDPVVIAWEDPTPLAPEIEATLGLWVYAVREKDGTEGWIHVAHSQFECTSPLAGDTGCRD